MGQFNLPTGGTPTQQHNQSYGVGLGSADAIAASAGAAQPHSDELFPEQQGQHDETEELFGGLFLPHVECACFEMPGHACLQCCFAAGQHVGVSVRMLINTVLCCQHCK